jgi:hypothetical protein
VKRTKLNNSEFQEREGKCNELEISRDGDYCVPYWNWYGFPSAFVGLEALDVLGKFFIGALALRVLRNKLAPAAAEPLAETRQRLTALE